MFSLHHFRWLLIVLAIFLASGVVWEWNRRHRHPAERNFAALIKPPSADAIAAQRSRILMKLEGTPEFAGFVGDFETAYRGEWGKLLDAFARRGAETAPEIYIEDAIRALRHDHGNMAGKASDEALSRVLDAQEHLLAALASEDPRLCVDFLLGQTSPAFIAFLGQHKPLLGEIAKSSLAAMVEGEKLRVEREPPGDADFGLIEAALSQRGVGESEISALLDGRLPDPPLPDATLCDAGLAYFETLRGLPADARMRVYALATRAMK